MLLRKLENKGIVSNSFIGYLQKVNQLIFMASGLTFLVYFFFEQFKTGLISNYFDLNSLIVILVITGIINFSFKDKATENSRKKSRFNWHYVIYLLFAILIGVFIYQQLNILGNFYIFVSFFSIISIYSIFILTLNKKK